MNVKEFIDSDLPFYHITLCSNKKSILKNGLKTGSLKLGVCVTRSSDIRVLRLIAIGQLVNFSSEREFCIFRIIPSVYALTYDDIKEDFTVEITNPLHNYIKRKKLCVQQSDIFMDCFSITESDIPYFKPIEDELIAEGLIVSLEYD